MDSLKPTEIIVSFSSLSYWNEPPVVATKDEAKTPVKLSKTDRESRMGDVPSETIVQPDAQSHVTGNTLQSVCLTVSQNTTLVARWSSA